MGFTRLTPPSDFSLRLPLPAAADVVSHAPHSRLEDEVVRLFDELRDRMLRYLLCLGVTLHEGEEIVQESFLLLFQHLQHGKSRENLRGWLFRVARNLALKLHRDHAGERSAVPFDEDQIWLQGQADANPEQQAYNRQRQKNLWAVVSALPEQDQICLFLRADGMRYREISKTLGISLGSVAASLARSLGKLVRVDKGSI
jgi:RNA polymerase sigma-70 factor, ECF subfamily